MNDILVICEGNICRSPMAEGLLTAALPQARIHSAGLNALSGMPPHDVAARMLAEQGIDISHHRAQQITAELCTQAELILVMSTDQRKWLQNQYPFIRGRVYRIGEHESFDVPDPYGKADDAFRHALRLIQRGVGEWIQRIETLTRADR